MSRTHAILCAVATVETPIRSSCVAPLLCCAWSCNDYCGQLAYQAVEPSETSATRPDGMNLRDLRYRFPIAAVRAADVTAPDMRGSRHSLLLDGDAKDTTKCQDSICSFAVVYCWRLSAAVHWGLLTQGNAYAGLRVGPHLPHCSQQGKADLRQHLLHVSTR